MPRQNRIDPFGALVAAPARGTLMGNRGCLHDGRGRIVRPYQVRRWIICLLAFKGRRRPIMRPGHYTELFFLDEATALAAGHRPCAECQRARYNAFRMHWAAANPDLAGGPAPLAAALDDALHRERISGGRGAAQRKATYDAALGDLPDGCFVVAGAHHRPHLVRGDALYPWSFAGYGQSIARTAHTVVQVLTPRSIVRALAHGYVAGIHPSALKR